MPQFQYTAISEAGEPVDGTMEATDSEAVIASLHAAGNYPVRVRPVGLRDQVGWRWRGLGSGISQRDTAIFTRELATLLGAGLPLDRSLEILTATGANPKTGRITGKVLEHIMAGKSLADALQEQGTVFSRVYVNTVRAGEASGSLHMVLERLADYLEKSRALRESIISATIYPAILLAVAVISLVLLLTQVVPQFRTLFDQAGAALPVPTQVVIALGDWLGAYWWVLLLATLAALVGLDFALKVPAARQWIDRLILHLPLFGGLVRKFEVARFARTFGTLLVNGVNPVTALSIVRETIANSVLAKGVAELARGLTEGRGIAVPLEQAGIFPALAVQMIRVGEETGALEAMLLKIADIYDDDVAATVKRALILLEPALILVLGLMIAGIIISVLLAVLNLNELAF